VIFAAVIKLPVEFIEAITVAPYLNCNTPPDSIIVKLVVDKDPADLGVQAVQEVRMVEARFTTDPQVTVVVLEVQLPVMAMLLGLILEPVMAVFLKFNKKVNND